MNYCRFFFVSAMIFTLGGGPSPLKAQGMPPLPGDVTDEVTPPSNSDNENTDDTKSDPSAYTDDVMRYAGYDWSDWSHRVRERFDTIGELTPLYPPLPKGCFFYTHEGVEVLRPPFTAIAEQVAPTEIAGVPTWTVFVRECVSEDGTRTFDTRLGTSLCHQIPVSQFYDPKAWARKWYGENGQLPRWLAAESPEAIQTWYDERDRCRVGFSLTFVRQEQLTQYQENIKKLKEYEYQHDIDQRAANQTESSPIQVTALNMSPSEVVLTYCNRLGIPLGIITAQTLDQNPWDFGGQINPVQTSGNVAVSLGESKSTSPHFFRLIDLQTDTDKDRLPDLLETHIYKTDPLRADTSGNGLNDWETIFVHGLNPSNVDSDHDNLLDGEEITLGTSPFRKDTDADGLTDIEEISPMSIRRGTSAKWFESNSWTELYPAGNSNLSDNETYSISHWGFSIVLGRNFYTTAIIDIDGCVTLCDPQSDEKITSLGNNGNLLNSWLYKKHAVLAPYWDDLVADTLHDSKIRYTTVHEGEDDFLVIEYLNMSPGAQRGEGSPEDWQISFQVALKRVRPGEKISHILFNYKNVGKNVQGDSATIGIQNSADYQVWQHSLNTKSSISSNMSIICVPGTFTDPLQKDGDHDGLSDADEFFSRDRKTDPNDRDTDKDGLSDGEEIAGISIQPNHWIILDPLNPDCDNDGLPDGWEFRYKLDPRNATGTDGADYDSDEDGLTNLNEYRFGTNPRLSDTDGDGLKDGAFIGRVEKCPLIEPQNMAAPNYVFNSDNFIDDSIGIINLPRPISLAGKTFIAAAVDSNGLVHFLQPFQVNDSFDSVYGNQPLETWDRYRAYLTVAIYWDDLRSYGKQSGNVRYGQCIYEGKESFVLVYSGFYTSANGGDSYMRLIIPYETTDTIIVQYSVLNKGFDCSSATIGIRQPNAIIPISYSNETADTVQARDALRYTLHVPTNPTLADSDGDGFTDGEELSKHGTDPSVSDSDNDGLSDRDEIKVYKTNPLMSDSDNDGISDKLEVYYGLPPLDNGSVEPNARPDGDWDGDGLSNIKEIKMGLHPGKADSDEDGLSDGEEGTRGTNPLHIDSDGDHLIDGWEVLYKFPPMNPAGDDILNADPDNDGLTNWEESTQGTNPYKNDSDGDGIPDAQEVSQGTNPIDPKDREPLHSSQVTETTFSIDGDYATWEMCVQGLGQGVSGISDNRLLKHHMRNFDTCEQATYLLRKGCSYKVTMRWLETIGGKSEEWYCWSAQINEQPKVRTYEDYDPNRIKDVATVVFGDGFWAENEDGLLCSHTHMKESSGGNVAGKLSAILHVVDFKSSLTPDYNRDLSINDQDSSLAGKNTPLQLWVNDDDDRRNQEYSEKDEDIPGVTSWYDALNAKIDGACDLLDFFPVHIDAQELFSFIESREDIKNAFKNQALTLRLSQPDGAVNVLWTSLTRNNSGAYLTENIPNCGEELDEKILDADVCTITADGIQLPPKFVKLMRNNPDSGIILIEGREPSTKPLTFGLYYENDVCVWKTELPMKALPVEELYGRVSLRDPDAPVQVNSTIPHNPNFPNVLFLHGFNVNENEARGWHAEMYKRLYQSGVDMNFYGITWRGDEALTETVGTPALHYHLNVYNAFKSAQSLASVAAGLPNASSTSVLAHSLGNVVVSESICTYGFKPDSYLLLNAAIPAEAFDASMQDAEANKTTLVPSDWRDYDSRTYASRWNELFSPSSPQSHMKWAGLFENIRQESPKTQLYNYFSLNDEVFDLAKNIDNSILPAQYRDILHFEFEGWTPWDLLRSLVPETTFGYHAWQKQEFLKGTNAVFGTADGGWLFNYESIQNPSSGTSTSRRRYTAEEANRLIQDASARSVFKQIPVFSAPETMISPNTNLEEQRNEHYKILAYRIPALSPAIGCCSSLKNEEILHDMQILSTPPNWPRTSGIFRKKWLHSDIKNMAFFYVQKAFSQIRSSIHTKTE